MALLFFEGAEKKVELEVRPSEGSLLDCPSDFWSDLVSRCNATILSEVRNEKMIAFLLSESSLFIWSNKILILTCGQTQLINSVAYLAKERWADRICNLIYQRKNECYARLQPSGFNEDLNELNNLFSGKAFLFGRLHGHHTQIFHTVNEFRACENDHTFELLMYDLGDDVRALLTSENLKAEDIRDYLSLGTILKDYQLNDYVFSPYGYSLNAISDDDYLTIHITPQPNSSYASLEFSKPKDAQILIEHFLSCFKPESFDLMTFNSPLEIAYNGFTMVDGQSKKVISGYNIDFRSYYKNQIDMQAPEEIL